MDVPLPSNTLGLEKGDFVLLRFVNVVVDYADNVLTIYKLAMHVDLFGCFSFLFGCGAKRRFSVTSLNKIDECAW